MRNGIGKGLGTHTFLGFGPPTGHSMADTASKRNPATGKVATPKAASSAAATSANSATSSASQQSMQDTFDALTVAVGARIKVRTVQPDNKTHEGILFTVDPTFNLIAINCTPAPPNPSASLAAQPGDYHIIPIRHIQSFDILSLSTGKNAADLDAIFTTGNESAPSINKVDVRRLKEREDKAVQKKKDEQKKKGKGVSSEAQELFNVLDRIYPTRWAGESIIIMDSVRIDPPYGADHVKAPKDKASMLPHLKRVVDGERKKILSRQGAGTPPVGPRKGG